MTANGLCSYFEKAAGDMRDFCDSVTRDVLQHPAANGVAALAAAGLGERRPSHPADPGLGGEQLIAADVGFGLYSLAGLARRMIGYGEGGFEAVFTRHGSVSIEGATNAPGAVRELSSVLQCDDAQARALWKWTHDLAVSGHVPHLFPEMNMGVRGHFLIVSRNPEFASGKYSLAEKAERVRGLWQADRKMAACFDHKPKMV